MSTAIQFLRSDNYELRPNPLTLADGMPMLNTNENEPGLFFKGRDGSLIKVGPCTVSDQEPNSSAQGFEGNTVGELWLDTSGAGVPKLRVYTGSAWTEPSEVTVDTDQAITGKKSFSQPIIANAGVQAFGQDVFAESLTLSGTATSAPTTSGMQDEILTTKGYVDDRIENISLPNALNAGDYISGGSYDGSATVTFAISASTFPTAGEIVARDGDGVMAADLTVSSLRTTSTATASSGKGLEVLYDQSSSLGTIQAFDRTGGTLTELTIASQNWTISSSGAVTFAGALTASNITAFKTNLAASAASATTIAALRTAIIDALNNDL